MRRTLNCIPPLASAVICTTPVVTTDEEELDTDDELTDEELTEEGVMDDWVLWLEVDDRLLADVLGAELLVLGAELLLEETGTTTLV